MLDWNNPRRKVFIRMQDLPCDCKSGAKTVTHLKSTAAAATPALGLVNGY